MDDLQHKVTEQEETIRTMTQRANEKERELERCLQTLTEQQVHVYFTGSATKILTRTFPLYFQPLAQQQEAVLTSMRNRLQQEQTALQVARHHVLRA